MLHGCYRGIKSMLQGCYRGFQRGVAWMLNRCYGVDTGVLHRFKVGIVGVLQGCNMGVTTA